MLTCPASASLREITERLRTIEMGLEADRRHGTPSRGPPTTAPFAASSTESTRVKVDLPAESNPLQILEQTIDKIESLSVDKQSPGWDAAEEEMNQSAAPPVPDAIVRGLVSIADCEAAFTFFHERLQPWISVMGDPEDRVPLLVQARSPFLFHVVLLVTNFYNTSTSERARVVYRQLCDIVNTLLAWQMLAPEARQMTDFVRGIIILLFYKPVQHSAMAARGITEVGRATHLSKVNALSSQMLQGIVHRAAEIVGLARSPETFLQALESATPSAPVPTKILSDLRLHYWLLIADIHGSLHSGRQTQTDPTNAIRTARLFASLKSQPCDPRRAAMLELYAIAKAPPGINAVTYRLNELDHINQELEQWDTHWAPILAGESGVNTLLCDAC